MIQRRLNIGQGNLSQDHESGQNLVEYGMILIFVAAVCVATVSTLGSTLIDVYLSQILSMFGT